MRNSLRSDSNSKSLSKLDEEIDKLIEEEINNKKKLKTLNNIIEDEEELTDQIPEDLDKKVLELAEGRELDMANSKKNKQRKKSIDILNEHLEDLYQKTINESKAETKGTDSLSKNSKLGKKRKLVKKKKDSDDEYINSEDDDNKSVNSFITHVHIIHSVSNGNCISLLSIFFFKRLNRFFSFSGDFSACFG